MNASIPLEPTKELWAETCAKVQVDIPWAV